MTQRRKTGPSLSHFPPGLPNHQYSPPVLRRAEVEHAKRPSPLPTLLPPALIVPSSSSDSNPASTTDPQTTVSSLQTQLAELRSRYDRLSEAKAKAAARHSADYKKWRDFKDWLYKSSTSSSLMPINGGPSISPKKRKAIAAGMAERKANSKKSRNHTVATLDPPSKPVLTVLEPSIRGPSTSKASDPSDTDDYEMDITDELVRCGTPLVLSLILFFLAPSPIRWQKRRSPW